MYDWQICIKLLTLFCNCIIQTDGNVYAVQSEFVYRHTPYRHMKTVENFQISGLDKYN